jgi:hypothetical protein
MEYIINDTRTQTRISNRYSNTRKLHKIRIPFALSLLSMVSNFVTFIKHPPSSFLLSNVRASSPVLRILTPALCFFHHEAFSIRGHCSLNPPMHWPICSPPPYLPIISKACYIQAAPLYFSYLPTLILTSSNPSFTTAYTNPSPPQLASYTESPQAPSQ